MDDQTVVVIHLHGVADRLSDSGDSRFALKVTAFLQKAFLFEEIYDDVIEVKHNQLKPLCVSPW